MTNPITLSTLAMATRFELVLPGESSSHLRAAGEEALEEIERLDAQLSMYRSDSEISWINAHAAKDSVKVEPRLFRLMQRAIELSSRTNGAFDITVGPLMRAWGFVGGTGHLPDPNELEAAREVVGMHHIHLDEDAYTIRFDREGVQIDLGAIGKGYAIERAVESLRDNEVTSALIHGGTSTIYGIGAPPNADAWNVAVKGIDTGDSSGLDVVPLNDSSLSVSAVHGKLFVEGSIEYGHVLDPRSGSPGRSALLAAVTGPSPTNTDALSTALLILGEEWLPEFIREFPDCVGMIVTGNADGNRSRPSRRA